MRTSEQTFWQWATRGIGGVVTIVEFLTDDGVAPSVEALAELARQHSRITDLIIRGELLYRQATGERTSYADQAHENDKRLREFGRQSRQPTAAEQVRGPGPTLHETGASDTVDFVGPIDGPGSAA